jgi:hypothetical protein
MKALQLLVVAWLLPQLGNAALADATEKFIQDARAEVSASQGTALPAAQLQRAAAWLEELQIRQKTQSTLNPFAGAAAPAYELRITPKAWGQSSAEQEALNWRAQQQSAQWQAAWSSALRRRYQWILELLAQHTHVQTQLHSASLLDSEVKLNRSLVAGRDFSVKRLLDAEVALAQAQGQASIGLTRLNSQRAVLQLPAHTLTSVLDEDADLAWITPNQILDVMQQTLNEQQIPGVHAQRLQWARLHAEDTIAQTRQRLGLAAFSAERFSSAGVGSGDKRTQFTVSLNIPLGNDGFKATDTRFAAHEAELAYQQRLADDTHALTAMRTEAAALVQAWELAQVHLQRNSARMANPAVKTDPELALALRQEDARQQRDLASLALRTRAVYLQYLYSSGLLVEPPLRHWLRPGTPVLTLNTAPAP